MSVAEIKHRSAIDARPTAQVRVEHAVADLAAGRSIVLFDPTCGEASLGAAGPEWPNRSCG